MLLKSMYLQHFRNYQNQKFDFSADFTVIIGPNTAGKTNLSEAIHLLLTGKSFRTSRDMDMIAFGQEVGRIQGLLGISNVKFPMSNTINGIPTKTGMQTSRHSEQSEESKHWIPGQARDDNSNRVKLEVVIASPQATGGRFSKKFLVNGVGKSRSALQGLLPLVLFRPEELDIIIDGPVLRRQFLDDVLEQTDKEYERAKSTYDKSLRQRNALLRTIQENPSTPPYQVRGRSGNIAEQFEYWDNLLIDNGQLITQKREVFLDFINQATHAIFQLQTVYDTSTISRERLEQYAAAEVGAGVTLVGPHRDDFVVNMQEPHTPEVLGRFTSGVNVRDFGSRGQQRLAVLQLKMLQIQYIQETTGKKPLLVLDDIFSELDSNHIQLVLDHVRQSQGILTTTHREFIPAAILKNSAIIELNK